MDSHSVDQLGPQAIDVPLNQIPELVVSARQAFDSGITRSINWRMGQLDGLLRFLKERQDDILDALLQDLGKPRFDALVAEIVSLELDVVHVQKRLKTWMRPEKVSTLALHQPGRSVIYKEPLGVVLIIAPWNYPLQLSVGPLIGALAAGNTAVLKPSEVAPATSALLARFLPEYLDSSCVKVVEGAIPETTKLLEQRFDHIFYTGNGSVGRIVMRAAAEHLTPVTLELGGKSPCIVDETADLEVTARRIVWGKFFNCGQTCVAPDYILVADSIHDALVERLAAKVNDFWGENPQLCPEYGRIVNARHHRRLMELLEGGGDVVCGGQGDESDRYLPPTILTNVPPDAGVMAGEIFGPILPIIRIADVEEAMEMVNRGPKPLALYLFSSDEETQKQVLEGTTSGGAVLNHCLLHNLAPDLPFGGVGESGMGAYHGKASFDTFTHRKSVLKKPFTPDIVLLYPPYAKRILPVVERLLRWWRSFRGS
jgi:aldehyde dehydrogenase (NAD+)